MKHLVFVWGVSSETRKEFSSSLINISIRYLLFITGTWWYFRFVNKKKNKRHITIVLYLSIKLYMWNQELYIWYEINQKNFLHLFQNEVIIRVNEGSKCISEKNMFLLTSFHSIYLFYLAIYKFTYHVIYIWKMIDYNFTIKN